MNILKSLGGGSGGGRSPGGSSSEPIQVGSHSVYVGSKIAEGGFAYVYKATDASTGTPYALKLLLVPSREYLAVVQQEIDIMASLPKHPNLVEFIDADVSQDGRETQVRILMEMCADGQVVDLMNARGAARLEEDEIFDIFSQMCAGVEVLHRQTPPIAHRDLKVENLLIARHGYKLCDFGSCTMNHLVPSNAHERSDVEDDIQKNTTMAYRAPEMLDLYSDKFICEKVDVWALGCVLYKLAFYVTPFEDGGSLKILNVKYKIPSSSRYSSQLHDFIKYMLNPDPAERPDIWDVIERVCTIRGVPVFATRPEGMENRGHVSFESVPVVTASRPRRPSFGEAAESPAGAPSSGGGGGGGGGAPAVKAGGGLFQMLDWQSGGGSGGSGGGGGGGGGGGQVAAASDPFGPAAGGDPFGPSTGTDPFGPTSTTADPFGPSSGGSADPFGTATGGTSTASLGATDPFNMSGGASGGGGASPLQQSSNDPFGSAPPSPFPPSSSASADAVFGGPATATSVSGGSPAGHAADPFGSTPSDPFAPAPQPAAGGSSGGGAVVDPFGPSSADPFPPVSGGSGSGGPRAGGGGGGDPFGGAGFGGPTERPDPFAATETAVARQQPPPRSVSAVQSTNSGARGATPIEAELLDAFGGSGGMLTLPEPGAGSQSKGHSRSSSVASDWRESGGRFAADADLSDESDSDDDTAAPAAGSSTSAAAYPRETTGTSGGLLAGLGERMKNAFASEYEKALIKATDTSLRGPKRKHVRNLIIRTWEDERVGDFYHALSKRPVLTDGTVAMKALSVVHCLLMEAHPSFLVGAGDNIQIFKEMRTVWKSRASDSAALVSAYAEFLVRKIEFHGNYTDVEGNYSIDDYLQHVEAEGGTPKRTGRGTIISGDAIEGLIAICTLGDALRKIAFADIGPAQEMKLSIMITVVEDSFNAYLTMTYLMAHLISFVTPSVFARLLRLYTDCYHSMRQFLMNADDATAISNIITVPQLPSELPVFQKGKEPDVHPPFSTNPAVFKSAAAHRPDLKVVRDKEQSEGLLPASPAAAAAASQAAKAKSPKSPKSPKSGDGKGLLNRSGSFSGIFKRQNYDNIDAQSDSSGGGGDGDGGDDGWVYADGEEASGSDFDEDEDADPFGGAGGAGFATLDDSATLDAAFPPPASNAGGGAGGDPFGPSTGDPFSAQAADPFGAPASDPFGGSSDPFPAPSKRLSGDRSAAPW